jgi:7-cyano-7-deazaguanine synthase
MKTVCLVSGGLDSVVALHDAARSHEVVAALSFDYGSKHNARELPLAREQALGLGVRQETLDLGFIGRCFTSSLLQGGGPIPEGHYEEATMKSTVVPFRNGIFLAVAAGFAESVGAEALVIGAHGGDHAVYPDCREPFLAAMGEAIRLGTYAGLRLWRPFVHLRKEDIVLRGRELGVDFSRTWSCYQGGEIHCGRCGTCVERREAFLRAGVADPTPYSDQGPLPPKPVPGPAEG